MFIPCLTAMLDAKTERIRIGWFARVIGDSPITAPQVTDSWPYYVEVEVDPLQRAVEDIERNLRLGPLLQPGSSVAIERVAVIYRPSLWAQGGISDGWWLFIDAAAFAFPRSEIEAWLKLLQHVLGVLRDEGWATIRLKDAGHTPAEIAQLRALRDDYAASPQ